MVRLHYANRLENLLAPLAAAIRARQRSYPLQRMPVIVPNRAIEEFVKLRVAEQTGVAANLEFPFLRRFLADKLREADKSLRIVEFEQLQVLLFECIRRDAVREDRELDAVRGYLAGGSDDEADRERRAMDLAGHVARLFREYSISRRAMIRRWRAGQRLDAAPFEDAERWQRRLWDALFDLDGTLRPNWSADQTLKWMLLSDAFDAADKARLKSVLPDEVFVFGLAYAGPAFVEIFARLGQLINLSVFALNPCQEFWEDVDDARVAERLRLAHRGARLQAGLEGAEDPFGLEADAGGDNPALRLWGRPGREYVRMLNELADCDFESHFIHPASGGAPTILKSLQESILVREGERAPMQPGDSPGDDGSVRILACPGIRREVEIVANEIWSLVRSGDRAVDSGGGASPLRFHEIGVLIPDSSCDAYLPHIESVFADRGLPVEITTRSAAGMSRVAGAIELLIRLPLGRLARTEVVRVLTHPAVAGSDPEIETELWSTWARELGVFFGADEEAAAAGYLPTDMGHWDQALKRLALGVFMTGEPSGDSRAFDAPGAHAYRAFEIGEERIPGALRMIRTARAIIADAIDLRSRRMRLEEWARAISAMVAAYIKPPDAIGERVRDRCLAAIETIATAGISSEPVGYEVVGKLALARIADPEKHQAGFSGRGVAAGALSALRAIPFRVVFVPGLGEASFPERDRHDRLDLRRARRQAGDVSPTERDRYLFLDSILAARERLYLSYVARDARTGDRLEPSSTIRELEFLMRGYVDKKTLARLTINHRVSRYDLEYFPDLNGKTKSDSISIAETERDSTLPVSLDPEARRGARMAALRADLARQVPISLPARRDSPPLLERLDAIVAERLREILKLETPAGANASRNLVRDEIRLSLAALRKFLECPLQGASRYALGMLEDDDADDDDDEPLGQSRLDRAILLREVFARGHGDRAAMSEEYERAFAIQQASGKAPAGPFAASARGANIAMLDRWVAQARLSGALDLAQFHDLRFGPADEFARSDLVLDPIVLEIPLPAPGGGTILQRVSLHGSIERVSPARNLALHPVIGKEPKLRDFIRLAISAVALAAAGEWREGEFHAVMLAGDDAASKKRERTLPAMSQDAARAYLATLVADLLSGDNHHFFPAEAAEEVHKEIRKGADGRLLTASVEDVRENENVHCGSDYGPVRNARWFDPPSELEMREIIRRRFDPISAIFGT